MIQTFCNNKRAHSPSRAPGRGPKLRTDTGGGTLGTVDCAACWPPRRGPPSCSGEGRVHRTARGHSVDASGRVANWPGTRPPFPPAGGLPRDPEPTALPPEGLAPAAPPGVQASVPEPSRASGPALQRAGCLCRAGLGHQGAGARRKKHYDLRPN